MEQEVIEEREEEVNTMEKEVSQPKDEDEDVTHGTKIVSDFGTTNTNISTSKGGDVEKLNVEDRGGDDFVPFIEINHKLNMMRLSVEMFEDDYKDIERNNLIINRFNGQPVVIYNMGQEDDYVQSVCSEYSKICHPYINLVYGYRQDENKDLLIIREYVHGENYFQIKNYEYLEDRLVAFYKCLCLIEYVHSFKNFFRVLRPEKFIIEKGITCVKLVDLIKNDFAYLQKIQAGTQLTDSMRFVCPELFEPGETDDSLEKSDDFDKIRKGDVYSVGCMFYYAITKKMPWEGYKTKDEVFKAYNQHKYSFIRKDEVVNDNKEHQPYLYDDLLKCFDTHTPWGEDLTDFREKLETRNIIKEFIHENGGDLLMNYEEGKYNYLILATKHELEEIQEKYLNELHLFDEK